MRPQLIDLAPGWGFDQRDPAPAPLRNAGQVKAHRQACLDRLGQYEGGLRSAEADSKSNCETANGFALFGQCPFREQKAFEHATGVRDGIWRGTFAKEHPIIPSSIRKSTNRGQVGLNPYRELVTEPLCSSGWIWSQRVDSHAADSALKLIDGGLKCCAQVREPFVSSELHAIHYEPIEGHLGPAYDTPTGQTGGSDDGIAHDLTSSQIQIPDLTIRPILLPIMESALRLRRIPQQDQEQFDALEAEDGSFVPFRAWSRPEGVGYREAPSSAGRTHGTEPIGAFPAGYCLEVEANARTTLPGG